MFRIEGKIYGKKEVMEMYAIAPKAFLRTIRRWFYSERKMFVGNRKKNGIFRRQIMGLKHQGTGPFARPGNWPKNVAGAISGVVSNITDMGKIQLTMGGLKERSPFVRGLAMMDVAYSGSRVINSNKNMTIPVYKNLAHLGIRRGFEEARAKYFDSSSRATKGEGLFIKRMSNGTVLYFNNADRFDIGPKKGGLKRTALLYIGKKTTKLKPLFDFVNQWSARIPSTIARGQTRIDRTTRALQEGYLKAE